MCLRFRLKYQQKDIPASVIFFFFFFMLLKLECKHVLLATGHQFYTSPWLKQWSAVLTVRQYTLLKRDGTFIITLNRINLYM